MKRDALYKIVDTILNHATEDDLEVIEAALQRRYGEEEENNAGAFQFSPRKAADESAHTIADQISYSKSTIRNMIKNFAVDIIRKEARSCRMNKYGSSLRLGSPTLRGT